MILHFHKKWEEICYYTAFFNHAHNSLPVFFYIHVDTTAWDHFLHPEKFVFLVREICSQNISGLVHLGMSLFTLQFCREFPHIGNTWITFFFPHPFATLKSSTSGLHFFPDEELWEMNFNLLWLLFLDFFYFSQCNCFFIDFQ